MIRTEVEKIIKNKLLETVSTESSLNKLRVIDRSVQRNSIKIVQKWKEFKTGIRDVGKIIFELKWKWVGHKARPGWKINGKNV